jgi:thymidine phosphorylase
MVGNANEVIESIETLRGKGPADVRELTLELCAKLLVDVGRCGTMQQARTALIDKLDSGAAYERFEAMVSAQGGRLSELPSLAPSFEYCATQGGIVQSMNGQRLGYAVIALGGGRKVVGQAIDFVVGLEMLCRVGDSVASGQPLVRVYCSETSDRAAAEEWIAKAFQIGEEKPKPVPLFQELN